MAYFVLTDLYDTDQPIVIDLNEVSVIYPTRYQTADLETLDLSYKPCGCVKLKNGDTILVRELADEVADKLTAALKRERASTCACRRKDRVPVPA